MLPTDNLGEGAGGGRGGVGWGGGRLMKISWYEVGCNSVHITIVLTWHTFQQRDYELNYALQNYSSKLSCVAEHFLLVYFFLCSMLFNHYG